MTHGTWRWAAIGLGLLALGGWSASLALVGWSMSDRDAQVETHKRGAVIADTLASTVQLFAHGSDGNRRAGSAVVLAVEAEAERSLLLTSGHLLDPDREQTVYMLSPAHGEHVEVTPLALDAEADLALLEAPGSSLRPVTFKGEVVLGDGVWVVAFPWGRDRTVVQGIVSQLHAPSGVQGPARMVDASVTYGMSGGGVFDRASGALVGIVRGYRSARLEVPGTDGRHLALPIAGETTVIATAEIVCFLLDNGADAYSPPAKRAAYADRCAEDADAEAGRPSGTPGPG